MILKQLILRVVFYSCNLELPPCASLCLVNHSCLNGTKVSPIGWGEDNPFPRALSRGLTPRPRGAPCRRRLRTRTAPAGERGSRESTQWGRGGRERVFQLGNGAGGARPRRPAPRPRGRALTSATLGPGRGAEPWKAARGAGAGPVSSSGRRPGAGANVEAAATSRGANRALTAAMAAPGQRGQRVTTRRRPAREPAQWRLRSHPTPRSECRWEGPRLRSHRASPPRERRWAGPRLRSRRAALRLSPRELGRFSLVPGLAGPPGPGPSLVSSSPAPRPQLRRVQGRGRSVPRGPL